MLKRLRRLSEESGIMIVNFGHAGDGNIHVNIMVDKADTEEYEKGLSLVEKVFQETLSLGGTISGEHGVGLTKANYIGMELSKKEIEIMQSIKKMFDPKNILNPGKIFPRNNMCRIIKEFIRTSILSFSCWSLRHSPRRESLKEAGPA